MKTTNTLRILAGLSFLIFFCPFFQTCSDASIIKNNHKAEAYSEEQEADKAFQDSLSQAYEANDKRLENGDFTPEEKTYLKKERKEWTFNAYEFSWVTNKDLLYKFEKDYLKELGFYECLILPVVILLSIIIFIGSLYKKFRLIFKFALLSLLLQFALSLLWNIDSGDLDDLRYGYYLFIINTIAITVLSYNAKQKQAHAV